MFVSDRAQVSTRKKLENGFLQVDAVLARTGIQVYLAGELGLTDRSPTTPVRVYRSPEEVFHPDSMASFAMVPLTDNHPADMVDASNAKDLTIGWAGENIVRDGQLLRARIIVSHKDHVARLENAQGKDELSNGYNCDLVWESGVSPEGETYDARQVNIRGNHIALVDAGRCGAECRILDHGGPIASTKTPASDCSCKETPPMADKALTKKVIDGLGLVESTDEGFAVIDAMARTIADLKTAASTAEGTNAAKDAAHTAALAAKDATIAELTAKVSDTASLDARANARAKLITDAKRIGGDKLVTDGLSDEAIKKAAVTAHMGEDKVKDKADTFFVGAFDYLAETGAAAAGAGGDQSTGGTTLGDALRPVTPLGDAKKTSSYEDRMANRWNANKKGAA